MYKQVHPLIEELKQVGFTAREVARALDVCEKTAYNWYSGKSNPSRIFFKMITNLIKTRKKGEPKNVI